MSEINGRCIRIVSPGVHCWKMRPCVDHDGCPAGDKCTDDPIWHLNEHSYNEEFGTCSRLAECRTCGRQMMSAPQSCEGKGDNDACYEWFMEAQKDARDLDAQSS